MIIYADMKMWLISILFYFLYGCLGVALTYHRLVSHGSFQVPKVFLHIGLLLGTLGGVGSILEWCAVHRAHHKHADTEKDPHGPQGRFLQMQFLAMLVPGGPRYITDLIRNKTYLFYHRMYWWLHAAWVLLLLMIDYEAIIYAYLFPSFILWHAMSSLGTLSHLPLLGYKNFDTKDDSRNIPLLGYLIFGEGWHNNHHKEPGSWQFKRRWFELDLTGFIIRLIRIK